MQLRFVGCGDAFGSGNRFNTCFHVKGMDADFLIDCGATSLIGLKRFSIDPNSIQAILVTHFHADHFGGIPFFILNAQFSKRTESLTIAGPPGLRDAFNRVIEAAFPGSSMVKRSFDLTLVELNSRETAAIAGIRVTSFPVNHGNPGGLYCAYRIAAEGRTIAYSGDTEWTDELIEAGRDADLFISEAYFYDKKVRWHLDLVTLASHLDLIRPKRLMLTHMSNDMLERIPNIPYEVAEDGKLIEI